MVEVGVEIAAAQIRRGGSGYFDRVDDVEDSNDKGRGNAIVACGGAANVSAVMKMEHDGTRGDMSMVRRGVKKEGGDDDDANSVGEFLVPVLDDRGGLRRFSNDVTVSVLEALIIACAEEYGLTFSLSLRRSMTLFPPSPPSSLAVRPPLPALLALLALPLLTPPVQFRWIGVEKNVPECFASTPPTFPSGSMHHTLTTPRASSVIICVLASLPCRISNTGDRSADGRIGVTAARKGSGTS